MKNIIVLINPLLIPNSVEIPYCIDSSDYIPVSDQTERQQWLTDTGIIKNENKVIKK
jgi:hypothetical protein